MSDINNKNNSGVGKAYLSILNIVTIVCIVVGSIVHIGGFIGKAAVGTTRFFGGIISKNAATDKDGGATLDSFVKADINLSVGDLEIVYGDTFSIDAKGYTEETFPTWKVSGNKLTVTQKNEYVWRPLGVGAFPSDDSRLTITIPNGTMIDLEADLNMGSIRLSDMSFKNIDLDADMGSVKLSGIACENINITAEMGSIDLKSVTFGFGDFDASMGSITLSDITCKSAECDASMGKIEASGAIGSLEADCSMGSVVVNTDNENAKLDLESDMGSVKVNGKDCGKSYKN